MKKFIISSTLIVILFLLTSCKLKTLVGATFVFDSFTFNNGESSDDLDPNKIKQIEDSCKKIVFHFTETTVKFQTEFVEETRNHEYDYTYVDGVLTVNSYTDEKFSIKGRKLYIEGTIDGFKVQMVYKLDTTSSN